MAREPRTKTVRARERRRVGRWRIEVTRGPSRGLVRHVSGGVLTVGSAATNAVVLADRGVSRRHLEVEVRPAGLRIRDLDSKNGTYYRGSRVHAVDLPLAGAVLTLGDSEVTCWPDDEEPGLAPSPRERCGRLVGQSARMRELFARVERVAATDATVVIHGETGAGKELVAEALHTLGDRRDGPFVVVDCGAVPQNLIESELFGHVRGAFTDAAGDHQGAFARADGGTLFLDEIGELDLSLQPRLLRVLETGTLRPVGGEIEVRVDVRVVAASLRDLAEEVRQQRFRSDLYYRLAVVGIEVPPLRAHLEDIPTLCEHFLAERGAPPLPPESLKVLSGYSWPGNVRQLRNVLERAVALARGGPPVVSLADLDAPASRASPSALLTMPYKQAKTELLGRFTREYLEALLTRHGGNVSAAAREAAIDRNWIVALARRYGLRVRD